ncbi:MAG: hypothetical protein NC305_11640 [Lachnospiraceae bacterium]|nr:hypothetical protein [Lachnospiraceae bacterium]
MEYNSLTTHNSKLTREQLLAAFDIFSGCCYPLWKWDFTPELELMGMDCPYRDILLPLFYLPESRVLLLGQTDSHPALYTLKTVFSWICQPVMEQELVRYYRILGPYFIGFKDNCIIGR